jgi:ribose transport system ATP-binding protein
MSKGGLVVSSVIEIEHLTKNYAGVQALADGCLEIRPGEVHGLVGANGAGKSTLIKILAGAVVRDGGWIRVDGKTSALSNERESYGHGLRFIHQDLGIAARLSVAENVFLGRKLPTRGGLVSNRRLREAAGQVLEGFVEVDPGRKISSLSVAQQWMVAVARSCTPDARVVVMDEPTAALSESEVQIVFDAVARLVARDLAVVFVSHRLPEILQIADRVTVMKDGRTVGTHDVRELDRSRLVSLIVGEERGSTTLRPAPVHVAEAPVALEVRDLRGGPLRGVSLSVREGEIVGVSGLVGSGRTSLLQQIFGIHRIDSGQVLVGGKAVTIRSPADAVKLGMAMIPEERRAQGLMLLRSVRDNTVLTHLGLFRWRPWMPIPVRRREVTATQQQIRTMSVKTTGTEQRISQLSGGNQQKVLVGRWLVGSGPRIVMLDEPTKGVDVKGKAELYEIIQDLAAHGVGIIVVSSDLEEIATVCQRTVVLVEGRTVGELTAPMSEADILQVCFQGRAA